MPKKKETAGEEVALDPGLQLLYDHIRAQFVANAQPIANHEKPERLLKMLQTCPELITVTPKNKELWKLVRKVRKEVLQPEKAATAKPIKGREKK